jgi:hypothetical protein
MAGIRVFIGYGYNARDKWIETHVLPLVTAFGCEVVHGRAVYGGPLLDEIVKQIQSSDAMIGFTTRRAAAGLGLDGLPQFTTHPWVVQELTTAMSQNPPLPIVEIREEGVISPGGMLDAANHQRIPYSEADRADCLREIALALERFRGQAGITTVRLRPDEVVAEISRLLGDPSFLCRCQTLRDDVESPPQQMAVLPIKGGLYLKLRGVADGDHVKITISAGGFTWRSDYESLDTIDMRLKP